MARTAWGITVKGAGISMPQAHWGGGDFLQHLNVRMSTVDRVLRNEEQEGKTVYIDCLAKSDPSDTTNSAPSSLAELQSLSIDPFQGTGEYGTAAWIIQADRWSGIWKLDDYQGSQPLWESTLKEIYGHFFAIASPRVWGVFISSGGGADIHEGIDRDPYSTPGVGELYFEKYRGENQVAPGDLLYWGREVVQVVSVTEYDPSPVPSKPTINTGLYVRRGACGSEQETHRNTDFDDVLLYAKNPIVLSRDVEIYLLNLDTMTEQLVWTGILEAPTATKSWGGFQFTARGTLAQAAEISPGSQRAYFSWDTNKKDSFNNPRATHLRPTPIKQIPDAGGSWNMIVAHGNAIRPVYLELIPGLVGGLYNYYVSKLWGPIMGTVVDRKVEQDGGDAVSMREILVGKRGMTHFYNDGGEEYLLHPFQVIRCLLCSRYGDNKNGYYDVLPEGWGLGIPDSLIDHDSIDQLLEPELGYWYLASLSMDNLIIGNNDDKMRVIIDRILKPIMCYITFTADNKITIKHFVDPGPDESFIDLTVTSDDVSMMESQNMVRFDPIREVRMKINRRGLTNKYGGEIVSTSLRRQVGSRFKSHATTEEIEALDYGNSSLVSSSMFEDIVYRALQAVVKIRYLLANQALHAFSMSIIHDTNAQPGMIARITHPAIFNPNTGENGITNARCFIERVGRDGHTKEQSIDFINVGATHEQEETVAPAWEIESVVMGVITIKNDRFSSNDRAKLKNGYEVTIMSKSGVQYIDAQGTYGKRTMTNSPGDSTLSLSSAFSSTPSAGDIIVLAAYSTSGSGFNEARHCYMASNTGDLLGDPPDRWGF